MHACALRRRGCSCATPCTHADPASGRRRYYSIFFSGPLTSCENRCVYFRRAGIGHCSHYRLCARAPLALSFQCGATALVRTNGTSRVRITQQHRAHSGECMLIMCRTVSPNICRAHASRRVLLQLYLCAFACSNCLKIVYFFRYWSLCPCK